MKPEEWADLGKMRRAACHYLSLHAPDGFKLGPIAANSTIVEMDLDDVPQGGNCISMKLEEAAAQLEALGNTTRLQIYRTLVRAGDNGMPVGRLQEKLDVAASTLSHHIRKLVEVGLVTQERQVTTLLCRANYPTMNALVGYLADECCMDADSSCKTAEEAEVA